MQYSFKKGLGKTILNVVIIGLPLVIQLLPTEALNLTLGAVLSLLINYLKVKYASL